MREQEKYLICNFVSFEDYKVRKYILKEKSYLIQNGICKLINDLEAQRCIFAVLEGDTEGIKQANEWMDSLTSDCQPMIMTMPHRLTSTLEEHLQKAALNLLKSQDLASPKEFMDEENLSMHFICATPERILAASEGSCDQNLDRRIMYLSGDGITSEMMEIKRDQKLSDFIALDRYKTICVDGVMGSFIPAEKADNKTIGELWNENGNGEIYCYDEHNCSVDLTQKLFGDIYQHSCGKCTLCREGLLQLNYILSDITNKKGKSDDIETITDIFLSLKACGSCQFGRETASAILSLLDLGKDEYEQHIQRKRCPNLKCKGMYTYYIKGDLCDACGLCKKECGENAIEGADGMIHIIQEKSCTKCGACEKVCPKQAVLRAGAVKPQVPDKLVPVGSFTSQKRGLMSRRRRRK